MGEKTEKGKRRHIRAKIYSKTAEKLTSLGVKNL